MNNPTTTIMSTLTTALDRFNTDLFGGELDHPVIQISRDKRSVMGLFGAERVSDTERGEGFTTNVIIITEAGMNRPPKEVLSTLVHEMAHQMDRDRASAEGYKIPKHGHGKHWKKIMTDVGLTPKPNGVGNRSMDHTIVDDGPFDRAFAKMEDVADHLNRFKFKERSDAKTASSQDRNNPKWVCPMDCGMAVRASRTIGDRGILCKPCTTETQTLVELVVA